MNPTLLSLLGGLGAANGGGWGTQEGSDLQVHSSDRNGGLGFDPRLLGLLGGGLITNQGQQFMQSPAGMGLLGVAPGMMGGGRPQQSNLAQIAMPAAMMMGRR